MHMLNLIRPECGANSNASSTVASTASSMAVGNSVNTCAITRPPGSRNKCRRNCGSGADTSVNDAQLHKAPGLLSSNETWCRQSYRGWRWYADVHSMPPLQRRRPSQPIDRGVMLAFRGHDDVTSSVDARRADTNPNRCASPRTFPPWRANRRTVTAFQQRALRLRRSAVGVVRPAPLTSGCH